MGAGYGVLVLVQADAGLVRGVCACWLCVCRSCSFDFVVFLGLLWCLALGSRFGMLVSYVCWWLPIICDCYM